MAKEVLDKYYLAITALVTIAYQLFFFAIAWTFRFDKVTDLAGGSNFIVLAILTVGLRASGGDGEVPSRNIVATVLLVVWGIRTSGFLFWRILKTGRDERFDEMREKFWSFLGFWVFQMIWVWTVSLPLTILNSPSTIPTTSAYGTALDIIGTIIWALGILIETISDIQKYRFRQSQSPTTPTKPHPIMQSGFWRYSRHPNYFGEIFLWGGFYLLCLSPPQRDGGEVMPAQAASVLSPLMTFMLLMFLSGLPLNEKPVARRRWEECVRLEGGDGGESWKAYERYLEETSILVPCPRRVYRRLPRWVKSTVGLEFGMYRFVPERDGRVGSAGEGAAGGGGGNGARSEQAGEENDQ